MACTEPEGALPVTAGSWPNGPASKIVFYLPSTTSTVTYTLTDNPPAGGVSGATFWTLTNAAGSILASGAGSSSGTWSLGQNDPHTILLETNWQDSTGKSLSPLMGFSLKGACTTGQSPCDPSPCASGCTCSIVGGTAACNCATPTCPSCAQGQYCSASTGYQCTACSPACAEGGVCGPNSNACTCPAGKCCPPCAANETCSGDACHACAAPNTVINNVCTPPSGGTGPPASDDKTLLIAGAGAVAILGAFFLVGRSRAASAPAGTV